MCLVCMYMLCSAGVGGEMDGVAARELAGWEQTCQVLATPLLASPPMANLSCACYLGR